MIRHTKFRCQININPSRTRRIEPGHASLQVTTYQNLIKQSFISGRQLTEADSNPEFTGVRESKLYSPIDFKTKISIQDLSTQNCTHTESGHQCFQSRQDLFESPPQHQKRSYLPFTGGQKESSQNRLMGITRGYSKSILINQSIDEFSLDGNEFEQKRGISEQLNRLRRENAELKRLLAGDWQCNCKTPYAGEQVQYLRQRMVRHYEVRCQVHNSTVHKNNRLG